MPELRPKQFSAVVFADGDFVVLLPLRLMPI